MSGVWAILTAFTLSLIGCWMITISKRLRAVAIVAPVDDRWHQHATPALGGIPIFFAFCMATCAAGVMTALAMAILISALPLLVTGVYDDLKGVCPPLKLAVQCISACVFLIIISSYGFPLFLGDAHLIYSIASFILCLIWIVGIINAINLLDNMDGLAGGIALISCLALAFLLYRDNQYPQFSLLLVILAASFGGFLVLNCQPAKLFMGDAGSLWIGLVIGTSALVLLHVNSVTAAGYSPFMSPTNWLLPLMICVVPISDTLMVMITRKLRGQPVSVGGRDHLSHRLVAIGLSERVSVAILWIAALIASLLAWLIHAFPKVVWITPVGVYLCIAVVSIVWLVRSSSSSVSSSGDERLCTRQGKPGAI